MNLLLTRTMYGNSYTSGLMIVGKSTLNSIEQPWALNLVGHSCVPDGTYDLIPYHSPKHDKDTWCLENLDLGISSKALEGERSYCEIHAANWAPQLAGCIAFGVNNRPMFYPASGTVQPAIEGSKDAVEELTAMLGPMTTGHILTIVPAKGLSGTYGYYFTPP
jgi:hypothetical protein